MQKISFNKLLDEEKINLGLITTEEDYLKLLEHVELIVEDKTVKLLTFKIGREAFIGLKFKPQDFFRYFTHSNTISDPTLKTEYYQEFDSDSVVYIMYRA